MQYLALIENDTISEDEDSHASSLPSEYYDSDYDPFELQAWMVYGNPDFPPRRYPGLHSLHAPDPPSCSQHRLHDAHKPTSPPTPPLRPYSTHQYSRADELLMSARMISITHYNIQCHTLTILQKLSPPLHLHNPTYHPSLIPQGMIGVRSSRRIHLRNTPTPSPLRTITPTTSDHIPPSFASHERSTIIAHALLRHPLPRNPLRSMTRRRASRSQCVRAPSTPSYVLAIPPPCYPPHPSTCPSFITPRAVAQSLPLVRRIYLPTRRTFSVHTCYLLRAVLRARKGLLPSRTRTRARTRMSSAPRSASVPSTSSSPPLLPVYQGPPTSPFPLFLLPPCGVVLSPCCFLRYEYRMKYPP